MNIREKLAVKLRMLREMNNYTQEYVAQVLDISPNTYSLLEKGQSAITISRMEKLASLYHLDLGDLLRLNDQNIFHQITHSSGICSENVNIHNTGLAEEERKLYKETIARLEAQNDKLMALLDKLSGRL